MSPVGLEPMALTNANEGLNFALSKFIIDITFNDIVSKMIFHSMDSAEAGT